MNEETCLLILVLFLSSFLWGPVAVAIIAILLSGIADIFNAIGNIFRSEKKSKTDWDKLAEECQKLGITYREIETALKKRQEDKEWPREYTIIEALTILANTYPGGNNAKGTQDS